jgi:hypothetical protein
LGDHPGCTLAGIGLSGAQPRTGAALWVLIVVISGDNPLRRIWRPAILVCP